MSFANHNILDIALSIIPPTVVQIRKHEGTVVNKYGQAESAYGEWIEVYGIVQPGGEGNEHTEGMDFSKKHVTIWLRGVALDGTHIQWAPDQIRFVDKIFNVVDVKDWFPYDNYRECDCVEVLNLDDSQRGKALNQTRQKHRAPRKSQKHGEDNPERQALPLAQPVQEQSPKPLKEEPAIFRNEEGPKTEDSAISEPGPTPLDNSLVGKASIRF